MADSGRTYSYGTNWTRSGGELHNGRGERIAHPEAYFTAVSSNSRGYNSGYSNGNGEQDQKCCQLAHDHHAGATPGRRGRGARAIASLNFESCRPTCAVDFAGKTIERPAEYFAAVATDKYGHTARSRKD